MRSRSPDFAVQGLVLRESASPVLILFYERDMTSDVLHNVTTRTLHKMSLNMWRQQKGIGTVNYIRCHCKALRGEWVVISSKVISTGRWVEVHKYSCICKLSVTRLNFASCPTLQKGRCGIFLVFCNVRASLGKATHLLSTTDIRAFAKKLQSSEPDTHFK